LTPKSMRHLSGEINYRVARCRKAADRGSIA
jgi:hypothetical protein